MPTLRVSPWEFSAIRKNAADLTEGEFVEWVLAKWPHLRRLMNETHDGIDIKVVVDYENGTPPSVWETIGLPTYVLVIHHK